MLLLLFSLFTIFYILKDLINGKRLRDETNSDNDRVKEGKHDEISSRNSSRRNSEAIRLDLLKFQPDSIAGDALLSPVVPRKISRTKVPNEAYLGCSGFRSRKNSNAMNTVVTDTVITQGIQYPKDEDTETIEILEFPTPKESPVYSMDKKRRGKCVIFHHQEFLEGNGDFREGSQYDVEKIQKVFGYGGLGFEVKIHKDLMYVEVCEEIARLSDEEDHSDADCICIFVLSHGSLNGKLHAKDVSYPFHLIWKPFLDCRSLIGKPKLFFIQACRGRNTDQGIMGRHATDSTDAVYTIPTHADFLFAYSTVEDHYSYRDRKQGTWYIHNLCEVVGANWRKYDLVSMLTRTSRSVAFYYISNSNNPVLNQKKQIPTFTSTLTRDLYFSPKN